MKPLLALVLAAMAAPCVFGTAQSPDILILDGKEVPLFENPLEWLWLTENGEPVLEAQVWSEPPVTPEEKKASEEIWARRPSRPTALSEGVGSSADWRGYVATWRIDGDRLVLLKIEQNHWKEASPADRKALRTWRSEIGTREVQIERVLPGKTLPVFADWYSGRLKIPQGKMTRYVHMGYGSEYERGLLIEFKNGVVVGRAELSNDGKNSYRSTPDLEWCALGQPVEDKGDWIDVRLFGTRRVRELLKSGEEFRTRGVFFRHADPRVVASLVVFETRKTKADNFPIHKLPTDVAVKDGSHVEITARFVVVDKRPELHVSAIRELQGGESMHAASFPEAWEKLQAEEAAEKTSAAKKVDEPAK